MTTSSPAALEQQDLDDLRHLLAAQDWREADSKTLQILLQLTQREAAGWLDEAAIARLPCPELHRLDALWSQSSGGQFGFSVQYQRYRDLNCSAFALAQALDWLLFSVGRPLGFFRFYSDLEFSLEAPAGHFPARWYWALPWWRSLRSGGFGTGRGGGFWDPRLLDAMMLRLERCRAVGAPRESLFPSPDEASPLKLTD